MNTYKKISLLIITLLLFVGVACNREEEPYLSVSDNMEVVPTDTTIVVTIESNVDWALSSTAAWCTPQVTQGHGDAKVQVVISANDTQGERSATLTLCNSDATLSQQIEITQPRLIPDSTTHYRLPVVFHVLYQKESLKTQNIIPGYLTKLIDSVNVIYANCGMDLGIEFVMATHDPNGILLEEPGVDRHQIVESTINCSNFMGYGKEPKKYCQYMWDPNQYINIFTYTFDSKETLGISHFPYMIKPHALEGITDELEYEADWHELPWPQCLSINNEYIYYSQEEYCNIIKTIAHEMGHFLGLRHVFSESESTNAFDECIDSDFCTDTPTYNKSAYDKLLQACMTGGLSDEEKEMLYVREDCETGEEYRSTNIMDYSYTDGNRFTPQQAARIRYVLEHSPYIPGPKVRLPEQQVPTTKAARTNHYVLRTFE